jgi:heptosyltransferase-3
VIRGGSVAEFVLTCPVFAALRAQFPETGIEVLGYPRIAEIAKAAGLVDEVRSIETRAAAGFFARNMPLDEDLSDYFAGFSIIFSYLYDPDGYFEMNVSKVSTAQFISGRARPDEGGNLHASETFLKPLERLAIFEADAVPQLKMNTAVATPTPKVVLHPNPETGPRAWPAAKWRDLAMALAEKGGHPLGLLGDASQVRMLESIKAELADGSVQIANAGDLPVVSAWLNGAQRFVGHDSGVTHLAAALGVRTVAVWGNSNAALWQPRGEKVVVLKNRAGAIGVSREEVLTAVL